jgi:branched-subunit amino acid ABC-type transport system permease component
MISPYMQNAVIQLFIVSVLCVGFSFSYQLERFPNFSYVTLSKIGTIISFSMTRLMGLNPYLSWPVAAVSCGLVSVLIFLLVVRPITSRGRDKVSLSIAMLALSMVLSTLVAMFSYWVIVNTGYSSEEFMLRNFDLRFYGYPGVLLISAPVCLVVILFLAVFLSKTTYGTTLRAVSNNEELAAVLGINTYRSHLLSWFISGFLTGLAGAIIPLWRATPVNFSDELLVTVMAGCFIGGIDNLYGAVLGALIVVVSKKGMQDNIIAVLRKNNCEIWLHEFGFSVRGLPQLTPFIILWLVLLIEPAGIAGIAKRISRRLRR